MADRDRVSNAPNDVLLHIFEHNVQHDHMDIWNIAQVSKHWRNVTLSCSGLWKHLSYNGREGGTPKRDIARMITQLERTRSTTNLQLDMTLHADYARSSHLLSEKRREEVAWKLVLDNAPRFRVVKLHGYLQSASSFPSEPPDFCNLHRLTLIRTNTLEVNGVIFDCTPLLNKLALEYTTARGPPRAYWTGLTVLKLEKWQARLPLFDYSARNIAHLETWVDREASTGYDQRRSVKLEKLRVVVFSFHKVHPTPWPQTPNLVPPLITRQIRAPRLESFTCRHINKADDPGDVRRFVQASALNSSLSSLSLSFESPDSRRHSEALPSILQIAPKLQHLDVSSICATPALKAMCSSPEGTLLVPQLKSLVLRSSRVALSDLKALVELRALGIRIVSGAQGHPCLREVYLNATTWETEGADGRKLYRVVQREADEEARQWALDLRAERAGVDLDVLVTVCSESYY